MLRTIPEIEKLLIKYLLLAFLTMFLFTSNTPNNSNINNSILILVMILIIFLHTIPQFLLLLFSPLK